MRFANRYSGRHLICNIHGFESRLCVKSTGCSSNRRFRLNCCGDLFVRPVLGSVLGMVEGCNLRSNRFLSIRLVESSELTSRLREIVSPRKACPLIKGFLSCHYNIFRLVSRTTLLGVLPEGIGPTRIESTLAGILGARFRSCEGFGSRK